MSWPIWFVPAVVITLPGANVIEQAAQVELSSISPPSSVVPVPSACNCPLASSLTAVPADRSIKPRCAPDCALSTPAISTAPVSAVRVMLFASMTPPFCNCKSPLRARTLTALLKPPLASIDAKGVSPPANWPASSVKLPPAPPLPAAPLSVPASETTWPPTMVRLPAGACCSPATLSIEPASSVTFPEAVSAIIPPGEGAC